MSLAIEKFLVPSTGHSPRRSGVEPEQRPDQKLDRTLDVAVVFTSVKPTLAALKEAGRLAKSLGARLRLVVPHVVPYPLPLEAPHVDSEFNEKRFRLMAAESPVETSVQIYLCRDQADALTSLLARDSIVVIGGRKRWWPTREKTLAKRLRRAGHEVVFKEME